MSTVNLALPAVQIREIRINSITGYQGAGRTIRMVAWPASRHIFKKKRTINEQRN
jgi:hypothetical protein